MPALPCQDFPAYYYACLDFPTHNYASTKLPHAAMPCLDFSAHNNALLDCPAQLGPAWISSHTTAALDYCVTLHNYLQEDLQEELHKELYKENKELHKENKELPKNHKDMRRILLLEAKIVIQTLVSEPSPPDPPPTEEFL